MGAGIDEFCDDGHRWRITHIVGVGLERGAKHRDAMTGRVGAGRPARTTEQLGAELYDATAPALVVEVHFVKKTQRLAGPDLASNPA
jgi:hypothetical protein